MLRIEPEKPDQAPSAILELVDGPKDIRFAMTARTVARTREKNQEINDLTQKNIDKVTRYRAGGQEALEDMIKSLSDLKVVKNRRDASGDPEHLEKRWGGRV